MIARRASIGRLQIAAVFCAAAVSPALLAQTLPPLDAESLPAAGDDRAPGLLWPTPELGDGPFLIESASSVHRNLKVTVLARLNQPWSMVFLPGGDMLVTERGGTVRLIRDGKLDPDPVPGVPEVQTGGLMGLMDIALHPDFANNRFVYLAYHRPVAQEDPPPPPDDANGGPRRRAARVGETVLARARWTGSELADLKVIFESGATDTQASRIGFGPDGMLYMSVSAPGTGEGTLRAQRPDDYAGKVVRLRDDGSIPDDNPFVDKEGWLPGIYTLGHRNGHSMVLNPWTNELWITEQGPNGGDEINILEAGANYGWPYVSYGRTYYGPVVSPDPTLEGTKQPLLFWVPSIAVTGMTFYSGKVFTDWERNAFVGSLRYGETPRTGHIQRIRFNDRWEEIGREPMLQQLGQRIRDVREGPDGLLYVLTAETLGALLRIEPGEPPAETAAPRGGRGQRGAGRGPVRPND